MHYKNSIKVFFDVFTAVVLLLLFSPLILITYLVLSISFGGSPIFYQLRPGKNEKVFKIIKFKTMNDRRDENGLLLPDEIRLTKIGSLIRKTSIDELPQLLNVLKGDMSIVGPRPLLVKYLDLYNENQKKRHLVKPGITGLAQVNGRNNISWEKKLELDVFYVRNQSFFLDLTILFKTLQKVIQSKDINKKGEATTSSFKGSK
ncbi:sugar transferase [Mesonia sp.]|uniref:sugar transferase n=1 Tax=Mesonia sp. TaxID=1960830 RepID=UPI001756346B|nr:sugar transferase [Mesonia sp.]HIB38467.1 sugar transferase [Mesonia sp.]